MYFGSTPTNEYPARRAIGFSPRDAASSALIIVTTAAASFRPDALPAVTLPSRLNAGRSLVISSSVQPLRVCSSASKKVLPLRLFSSIGRI